MNILVTGSSGFIGSYFLKKYKNVFVFSNFSFQNDDINALDLKKINAVVHLSALVHQMNESSNDKYEKINVFQTLQLAKKAKKSGVNHFVFMSTVKVYGEETNIAYTEDSSCLAKDAYGQSKLKAENELIKLADDDFKVSIIRTPIVYGYGVKANIKSLIGLINKIQVLPFSNIQNKRSMVYIGNLCYLIYEVINQKKGGVFLAGDDKSLSTSELILSIANALEKRVFLLKIPFFEMLLRVIKPSFHKRLYESLEVDNQKTKKKLSLNNPYSTDEGIKLMIKGEEF